MILHGDTEKKLWRDVFLTVATRDRARGADCAEWADYAIKEYRKRANVNSGPTQRTSSYDVRDQAGTYDP